jgi:hypothetical protein
VVFVIVIRNPTSLNILKNPQYEIKVVSTKPALHFFDPSQVDAEVITDEDEWHVSHYPGRINNPIRLDSEWYFVAFIRLGVK